jgi:hypothetical protein
MIINASTIISILLKVTMVQSQIVHFLLSTISFLPHHLKMQQLSFGLSQVKEFLDTSKLGMVNLKDTVKKYLVYLGTDLQKVYSPHMLQITQ